MLKLTPNHKKVIMIFKPDVNGHSIWISIESIINVGLNWTNNGNQRNGKFFNVKDYNWQCRRIRGPRSKIIWLRLNGFDKFEKYQRYIRKDIKKYYKNKPCVACGSKSSLICDHKNDLYNDPRVLNMETQTLNDFQSLCNGCNLRKREAAKKTRETGERYPATNRPDLKHYGIDFVKGNKTYDKNDPNAMVGSFWNDPPYFRKEAARMHDEKIKERTRDESKKEIEDLKKEIESLKLQLQLNEMKSKIKEI